LVFGLVHGWTSVFWSTRSGQNQVKYLMLCLVCHCFDKKIFWLKGMFGKHVLRLVLTFFVLNKNIVLPNVALKIFLLKIKRMIFSYYIRLNPYQNYIFICKMERNFFFSMILEIYLCWFSFASFGIYKKYVKFLKNLVNISITLKL